MKVLEVRKVITMLEVCCPWYIFHCKTIRNAANFEKSRSKISHFRLQKSEKSPAKSRRDWIIYNNAKVSGRGLDK